MSRYLSPKDIAEALRIHVRDAYRIVGQLPRIRLGRRLRVLETDFAAYLKTKEVPGWDASTNAPRAARTGLTTPTRPAGAVSSASEPVTGPSPANDSEPPSWLRPLKRGGASNG